MSLRTRRELFARRRPRDDRRRRRHEPRRRSRLRLRARSTRAGRLTFGDLEPLVAFLQETPPDKLLPKVAEKLKSRHRPQDLVAAAALANARAFGGEDYVGFHTLMALAPAYQMAKEETKRRAPAARGA